MEKRINKTLPNLQVLRVCEYFRFALLLDSTGDDDVYIIVRMVAPTAPHLNVDGSPVPEKKWKHFVPIAIKACAKLDFAVQLFDKLCSSDGEPLPLF